MPLLFGLIGEFLVKLFTDNVIRWIAFKVFMTAIFLVVLPLVLNNFIYDLMSTVMNWISSNAGTTSFNPSQSFGGITGYLMNRFQVSQCMAVVMSGLIFRLVLKHVPFFRF
jgi:hypothetical protein